MRLTAAILALALAAPALATEPGHRLLMVEQPGCPYCRLFDRDLAPIYPLSPEGRAAPLVRVQLRGPYPQGVTLASPPSPRRPSS